jgi:hypothetical protein
VQRPARPENVLGGLVILPIYLRSLATGMLPTAAAMSPTTAVAGA